MIHIDSNTPAIISPIRFMEILTETQIFKSKSWELGVRVEKLHDWLNQVQTQWDFSNFTQSQGIALQKLNTSMQQIY